MNRRRKFLFASVLALQNSSFIYPSCLNCFSRLIVVSKRSNCPKCGSTGEAENASYRYKLSLKVAESNKLFIITVFGSCLNPYFGLTATDLYRYIQDPNKIPETLDSGTTQSLLTKAVETCFVGQTFIFGVTNFENKCGHGSDSSNFLQQCYDHKREVKALVACQIVLPDPRIAGFTVIDYFHQLLQTSSFRKLHCGSQEPTSLLLALDHSDSDLSSIHGSDSTSYFLESHSGDDFSRFWPPSLELTSTLSQITDSDSFSATEQSMAVGTLHQNRKCISFAEVPSSNSYHNPVQDPGSLVSYVNKKSPAGKLDEEHDLQANQLSEVCSSYHENEVANSNFFTLKMQEPFESSNTGSFHSTVEVKSRCSQQKLPCCKHHDVHTTTGFQGRSTCCSPSSLRPEGTASNSQDDCDPMIWDDLPFSESLNKFLEDIESEIAVIQADAKSRKHGVDNDIDKFHTDHDRLSVTPHRIPGAPPIALQSSQATVKENSSRDNFFSKCEANQSPSIKKESQLDNTAEAVSIKSNGRDISEYFLPNTDLSALLPSSKDLETTITLTKTIRILPYRNEISLQPRTSKSDCSCLSIRYFTGCRKKSLVDVNEKLTTLCSRKYGYDSDPCKLESKQYCRWPKNQGDSFKICRKLTYPLETPSSSPSGSTDTLKEMPRGHNDNNLIQSYSGQEGSYNASADLFDDIAKDVDIATEIIKNSPDILLQHKASSAKSHTEESDFSLRSRSENPNQPPQKLSLQSISASRNPRTGSPPLHFRSDSEYDVEDSQDFVPCSQSTPVAGFYQTRIRGLSGPLRKLPSFYLGLNGHYKKSKVSPENDKQQATPGYPKNIKTPSQKSRNPILSSIIQPEIFNLESDVNEWVPPTTQKVFLSDVLGFPVMGLRKCLAAHNSPEPEELPRKKVKHVKQSTGVCLIKKELKTMFTEIVAKQKTPKFNWKRTSWVSKEPVLGFGSFSEVKCCLPSPENCPPSVSETKSAWSPELFS